MDLRKATAVALAVLVSLTLITQAVPLTIGTAPPDTSILQEAVNAYASIGLAASCATYLTYKPDGSPPIVNNSCRVGDAWVDANLTVQMSSDQLRAAFADSGSAPADLFTSDPMSTQITPAISSPTSTTHTPITEQQVANEVNGVVSDVNRGIVAASLACGAAGAINSFFLGGGATEVTQICNHAALLAAQVTRAEHYSLFQQSLVALNNRGRFAAGPLGLGTMPYPADIRGESAPMAAVANGSGTGNARGAWATATVPMKAPYLQRENLGSPHLSAAASVNMTDSFGADGLRAVGDIRNQQATNQAATTALRQQILATDPASNTPVAQQNITNAVLMHVLNNQATEQSAYVAILEQLLIANTWQRNGAATTANNYAHTVEVRSVKAADLSGTSSAIAYRMP